MIFFVWQLDCGIHPGLEGMDALPYIDLIDPAEIDLLLISQSVLHPLTHVLNCLFEIIYSSFSASLLVNSSLLI